jgi:hypothetical protein
MYWAALGCCCSSSRGSLIGTQHGSRAQSPCAVHVVWCPAQLQMQLPITRRQAVHAAQINRHAVVICCFQNTLLEAAHRTRLCVHTITLYSRLRTTKKQHIHALKCLWHRTARMHYQAPHPNTLTTFVFVVLVPKHTSLIQCCPSKYTPKPPLLRSQPSTRIPNTSAARIV